MTKVQTANGHQGVIEGGARTTSTALPLTPSSAALIVAVPARNAVIDPELDTVATDGSLVSHVIPLTLSGFPPASNTCAVAWAVPPTSMAAGVIDTSTRAASARMTV